MQSCSRVCDSHLLQMQQSPHLHGLQQAWRVAASSAGCCLLLLQGSDPKQFRQQYEEKLRAAEMEAIQDYIAENDHLVTLHKEVCCVRAPYSHMRAAAGDCTAQPDGKHCIRRQQYL